MLRMNWHIIFTLFLTMSSIPESSSLTVSDKQITLTHHDYEKSWNEAQAICVAKGGSLFTEDSTERSNVIANFRGSWTKGDVWIGLHYPVAESADEYGWTDCFRQDLTANTHWMSSEPKKSSSQRCAISDKTGGDWRTAACDSSNRFVCQTEGGACTFTTGSGTPITPLNYEAVSTTAATIDSCKSRCLTTTHNFKNCWALNYAVTSVCVLYYTDDPFLFLPLGITTGSTAFHVKECYTSTIDTTNDTTITQAPAPEPQAGCTTFNDRTTPATTTTTTTAVPTTTTTTAAAPTTTTTTPATTTTTTTSTAAPTTTTTTTAAPITTTTTTPAPTTTTTTAAAPTTTTTTTPVITTTTTTPAPTTTTTSTAAPTTTTTTTAAPTTTTTTTPAPTTTTTTAAAPTTTTTTPVITTTTTTPAPTTTTTATAVPTTASTTIAAPTSASTTTAAPTAISTNTHVSVTTAASTTTSTTTQAAATTSTVSSSTSTTPVATSSTTTQASSTTSTSSTTLSTTTAQTQCFCPCSSGLSETANLTTIEKVALIQSKLKVDSKSLSSTVRKKTSAKDERKASQSVGYIAIAFSCVQLGFIVIPDLFKVVYYCFNWWKSSSAVTP